MSEVEGIENIDWKWLNEEKLYRIYKIGKVYSVVSNKYLNPYFSEKKQYYELKLQINNKLKRQFLHMMIYTLFVGDITKKYVLVYLDGNKRNCKLDNMILKNRVEFNKNITETKKHTNIEINNQKQDNDNHLENIEWKYLNDEKKYKVYKDGRIFSNMRNVFLNPRKHYKLDCFIIDLRVNDKDKIYLMSTLIFTLFKFHVPSTHLVIYIDNNYKNFHIDNLALYRKIDIVENSVFDDKEWKYILEYENRYIINKKGDVISLLTNKTKVDNFNIKFEKNYKKIKLYDNNGIAKEFSIHRLVYSTFSNTKIKEFGDKVVDHIDRNTFNNNFENLRLVSQSENAKNCIRQAHFKKKNIIPKTSNFIPIKTINKKMHKGVDFSNYHINEYGDIKNIITNKILCPYAHLNYSKISIQNKLFLVHRLVASTFIENPNNYEIVNHKDRDRSNNHVSNLEWVTHKENMEHALAKSVEQYTLNNEYVKTHKGVRDAYREVKNKLLNENATNASGIGSVCNGKAKTAYGYKWKWATIKTQDNN
jgi:hypothetical protein